jgi:outer membrane protein
MNRTTSCIHAILLAGVWVSVAAPLAHAQPRTVTLEALERQALASRPSLSAQQARLRRAAAEVERRRSAYNPSITLGSDVALSPGGTLEHVAGVDLNPAHEVLVQGIRKIGDRDAFAAQARYGATLDISMNVYDFGRTALAVEAARAEQAAATADDRATRRQVLDDVRSAYLAWLTATEVAAVSEQAVADAQARHTRIVDLVAEGVKPAADISAVASDEALARLDAARSRADVENARIMLTAAIGGDVPADVQPDRRVLQIDEPSSSIAGATPASSPDDAVHALERQRDAARATAIMYDRMHTPVIGAEAQIGVRAQNPIVGGGVSGVFPMYRVGVSLSVPLWDGGTASANANVARAQAEELGARSRELSQARQTARTQAEADAAAARERLGIARELLALSERRLREAEERYEEAGGRVEAIAEANAMRRRASTEIVLAEIATARAHYTLQDQ